MSPLVAELPSVPYLPTSAELDQIAKRRMAQEKLERERFSKLLETPES